MDTKNIVITALFAAVVLLFGYLLGQRKNRNLKQDVSNEINVQSPHPPTKKLKDYSKQLASARDFQQRMSEVYAIGAEDACFRPFVDIYDNFDRAIAKFNPEKNEHTRDELLTYTSEVLECGKFNDLQGQMVKAAEYIGNEIIEYYDEQLEKIFAQQPFESLAIRYKLNSDLRATQVTKIRSIISEYFTKVILDAHNIEQSRAQLKSAYPKIVEATKAEFDWIGAAKSFGMGALAVAHPVMGITALISNFKNQSTKDKSDADLIDNFSSQFDELVDKIHGLRQEIIDAADKTKHYARGKFRDVNCDPIVASLMEIASNGYAIDHYFTSLDFTELKRIEQDLDVKG
jgi:hypothetical protein